MKRSHPFGFQWILVFIRSLFIGVSVVIYGRISIGLTLRFVEKYLEYYAEDAQRKVWLDTRSLYERLYVEVTAYKLMRDWLTQRTKDPLQSYVNLQATNCQSSIMARYLTSCTDEWI